MPMYSEKVMDHFVNPRNVGQIDDADGVGEVGNPVCGDVMTFYIKVKDNRLEDVKFKTFGCGAAIAISSIVSEMAKGKTLEDAMKITPESVVTELEGLPKQKLHCSNLGAQALHAAIEDYKKKEEAKAKEAVPVAASAAKPEKEHLYCPYCDKEIAKASLPYCTVCGLTAFRCPKCQKLIPRDEKVCPSCGANIQKEAVKET